MEKYKRKGGPQPNQAALAGALLNGVFGKCKAVMKSGGELDNLCDESKSGVTKKCLITTSWYTGQ